MSHRLRNYFVLTKLQSLAGFEKKNNVHYLILRIRKQTRSKGTTKTKAGEKMKKKKFQRKNQVALVRERKKTALTKTNVKNKKVKHIKR